MPKMTPVFAASLLFVLPVVAAPIDEVTVTPLPGTASCYPGTAGTDYVIFHRADNGFNHCSLFPPPSGPVCLNRREFATDGANGIPVSLEATIVIRPSVNGFGDTVSFTQFGFNVCFMGTNSQDTEGCYGRDWWGFDPHSASIHPDATEAAITQVGTFSFLPTRFVHIANTNLQVFDTFQISTPEPGGDDLRIETVDFTVDRDYLILDARNPVSGLWGIYAVDRATAATIVLVPPVAGLEIRNPSLAQTSDDHLVFDAFDLASGVNYVLAANLLTGDVNTVATTAVLGYPSYTGDDSAVIFDEADAGVPSQASMDRQPVGPDRMTPSGLRSRWLTDGGVPAVYRRGNWDGTLLDPALCAPQIVDSDGDGIADNLDNCSAVANANQVDADGDSIGNVCDADFNNDCIVNAADLGFLKSVFFSANAEADINSDGVVNAADLGLFKSRFFMPPGPSGLPDLCD